MLAGIHGVDGNRGMHIIGGDFNNRIDARVATEFFMGFIDLGDVISFGNPSSQLDTSFRQRNNVTL